MMLTPVVFGNLVSMAFGYWPFNQIVLWTTFVDGLSNTAIGTSPPLPAVRMMKLFLMMPPVWSFGVLSIRPRLISRWLSMNVLPSTTVPLDTFHIRMAGPASSPCGARIRRKRLWRITQLRPVCTSTPFV